MKKNYRIPLIVGASVLVVVAAAWAVLANRGSNTMDGMAGMDHSSMTASNHNDADVMFAQMMVPHHAQAIDMSNTLLAKTSVDARVVSLATDIKNAQQPEIDTMNGWLKNWNATSESSHSMSMTMSDADMKALEDADGPTASKLFLSQMVEHHKSAIDMATTEARTGKYGPAIKMATNIINSQTDQIAIMQQLESTL